MVILQLWYLQCYRNCSGNIAAVVPAVSPELQWSYCSCGTCSVTGTGVVILQLWYLQYYHNTVPSITMKRNAEHIMLDHVEELRLIYSHAWWGPLNMLVGPQAENNG